MIFYFKRSLKRSNSCNNVHDSQRMGSWHQAANPIVSRDRKGSKRQFFNQFNNIQTKKSSFFKEQGAAASFIVWWSLW